MIRATRAVTDPSISLTKTTEIMRAQDRIIAADPAVEMVVGKIGRAETSTDPAPINMSETIITFKPKDQWPAGLTKDVRVRYARDFRENTEELRDVTRTRNWRAGPSDFIRIAPSPRSPVRMRTTS
ncbi:MAG: efflux RND transporter permease subunit [Gammaproteobacteria bacterium]